ncbi:MAG: secretion system protein, partial [Hydrotalea flava]|nr:secretion system protein [Hydrotalea flava]
MPGILAAAAVNYLDLMPGFNLYILGGALIAAAVWPALNFKNKYKFSLDAEGATAQIMRDVAEARK